MNTAAVSRQALSFAVVAFVIAIAWYGVSAIVGPARLPTPTVVIMSMSSSWSSESIIAAQGGGTDGFRPHVLRTLCSSLAAVSAGALAAIALGAVSMTSRNVFRALSLIVAFARGLPPLIAIPLVLFAVPAGTLAVLLITAAYSFLSMLVYVRDALAVEPVDQIAMARLSGASGSQLLIMRIHAALAEMLGGLRVTAVVGVGVCVVAEYLVAPSGVGRVMKYASAFGRVDLIMVSALWAIVIAVVLDHGIHRVVRPLTRWRRREADQA